MVGAWSCLGRFRLLSVTGELARWGLSGKLSDVRRTPRLVACLGLILEVGIHANGKGENSSNKSGVWRKTLRLFLRLFV